MKAIAKIFEEQRKHFEKGGKFELLYPLFEAKETFLFTTAHKTKTGSHIRDAIDTKRLMSTVIMALVPCLLFGIYNVGYQYHAAQGVPADFVTCMLMGCGKCSHSDRDLCGRWNLGASIRPGAKTRNQ